MDKNYSSMSLANGTLCVDQNLHIRLCLVVSSGYGRRGLWPAPIGCKNGLPVGVAKQRFVREQHPYCSGRRLDRRRRWRFSWHRKSYAILLSGTHFLLDYLLG